MLANTPVLPTYVGPFKNYSKNFRIQAHVCLEKVKF